MVRHSTRPRPGRTLLSALLLWVTTGMSSPSSEPLVVAVPLRGEARATRLAALAASGLVLLGPLDRRHVLVDRPADVPRPEGATPLEPADRLTPGAESADTVVLHPVPRLAPSRLASLVKGRMGRRGVEVRAGSRLVEIRHISPGLVRELAELVEILAIVPVHGPVQPANDQARGLLQSAVAGFEPFHAWGIAGQGEIIAIADSGLTVTCDFEDPSEAVVFELVDPAVPPVAPLTNPAHRKLLAYQWHAASDTTDSPATGALGFHGTAVAAIVAGDSGASTQAGWLHPNALPPLSASGGTDGQAPGARLVVQDVADATGQYLIPFELAGFVVAAWRAGARVWNASWGVEGAGSYDHFSRELDVAASAHPELVLTIAAGNDGPGPGTVVPPSTCRNGLAVGNSSSIGGFEEDLFPTSSHGPTLDGRRKPDLVAPGSGIDTADGDQACASQLGAGTSFAAPAVAAAAAMTRQYFREGREAGGFPSSAPTRVPSSALVRAALAAGAQSLLGGAQMGVDEQPAPSPEQGWGRLVLANALPLPGDERVLGVHADDDLSSTLDGFATGAMVPLEWTVTVRGGTEPLVVALAWTDPPPAPLATSGIVNDLDLELDAPGGDLYLGNAFVEGWSIAGGAPDAVNSIEIVRIAPPVETGTWTLRVVPRDVVVGPQPHALLSIGTTCAQPIGVFVDPPVVAEASCGVLAVAAPTVGGVPPVVYDLFRADSPGGQDFGAPLVADLTTPRHLDVPPAAGVPYFYVFEARDACGSSVRSVETGGGLAVPCAIGEPLLTVRRSGMTAVTLQWDDVGPLHEVRRHVIPWLARGGPVVGDSALGEFTEDPPPARLTCWVID